MRVVRALGADIFFFRAIFRNNARCELDLKGRGPLGVGGSAGLLGRVGWTAQRQVPPLAHAASHDLEEDGRSRGEINQVTRGWCNYFPLAHCSHSFAALNSITAHRRQHWLWRKHGSGSGGQEREVGAPAEPGGIGG